jgi:N-acetylglucosamine kinase-like BadF-type ATPase
VRSIMENQLPTKTPDPLLSDLVIGVDGGGTKTVAWLAPLVDDGANRVLGRGWAGPGNPRAAGFETAQANMNAAIAAAFADAGLPRTQVAAACFGLAGAGRPAEQEQIAAWARRHGIARKIHVCGDAEPILAAASPDNWGIALIAGTGSLAWGRNKAGETARCGGWGYLLGDEGSGYAIALAGLRAAMRAADGRGPQTDLLPRFFNQLGAQSPADMIVKVYSAEMSRDKLAALSEVVFDLATTDEVAGKIIDDAVEDLADLVGTLARQLRLSAGGYTLAMAGGVLVHQLNYMDRVLPAVHSQLRQQQMRWPEHYVIVEEPVSGAVALARSAATGS